MSYRVSDFIVLFTKWIIVGGANRIARVGMTPGRLGGVTNEEAFKLLATEWGRLTRFYAENVVRAWEQYIQ